MSYWKLLSSTACISLLAAQGALADVTPEQVWENLQTQWKGYGYEIEAQSTAREGDALVVKGVEATTQTGGNQMTMSLDHITLTDKGDGSVVVTQADTIKFEALTSGNAGSPDAKPGKMDGQIAVPGMEVTVSGAPEAMVYDYSVPAMDAKINALSGVENITVGVMMKGVKSHSSVNGDAEKLIEGSGTADSLAVSLAAGGAESVNVNYELSALTFDGKNKLVGDMADMGAALKAGSMLEGKITYGSAKVSTNVKEGADMSASVIDGADKGGEITYFLDAQKMEYGATGRDGVITMAGPEIPVPQLSFSYKEMGMKLGMPVSQSETASDFAFAATLKELAIGEELWAMVDAGNKLPHDPMSYVLDISGKAAWSVDIFDEKAMAALQGAPGKIESVKLNDLTLSAVGVNVTGKGDVTFDNSDMTTFNGMPAPTGQAEFKAVGVNKLFDTLVEMGLMPQDQAMGMRMMMGMFAKPVEGEEDALSSVVEFKDKGMFVNGTQMK